MIEIRRSSLEDDQSQAEYLPTTSSKSHSSTRRSSHEIPVGVINVLAFSLEQLFVAESEWVK
jgi:hypothetical protein